MAAHACTHPSAAHKFWHNTRKVPQVLFGDEEEY